MCIKIWTNETPETSAKIFFELPVLPEIYFQTTKIWTYVPHETEFQMTWVKYTWMHAIKVSHFHSHVSKWMVNCKLIEMLKQMLKFPPGIHFFKRNEYLETQNLPISVLESHDWKSTNICLWGLPVSKPYTVYLK